MVFANLFFYVGFDCRFCSVSERQTKNVLQTPLCELIISYLVAAYGQKEKN